MKDKNEKLFAEKMAKVSNLCAVAKMNEEGRLISARIF
jgi:hypothetical protein